MRRPLCCVCVAFVVTVFLYLEISPPSQAAHDFPEGERITLQGEVCQKEYRQNEYQKNTLVVRLKNVREWGTNAGRNTAGADVICYMESGKGMSEPKTGSVVAVEGKVSYFDTARNPGEFDAQKYYQILGVGFRLYEAEVRAEDGDYSVYREGLYRVRRHFEGIFDRALAPKDASVMKAILLGNRSGLDAQSRQLFQKSGIAHILAISGLHITLLGMGLYRLLCRVYLPKPFCAAVSVGMMLAYGDMVGMSSSAYRAVFMFGVQLAAVLLRRTYDMLTALSLAAVLILSEQPLYLYHSGFQLSFGAVLGAGCLSEVVRPVSQRGRRRLVDKMTLSLWGSLSIFLVQFPIMLCTYYEFPVYSFLLNLVVIPALPFLMAAGLLCLCAGSVPTVIGAALAGMTGVVCHGLLSLFECLCTVSLELPFAGWIIGRPQNWQIYGFCATVLFLYAAHHYGKYISRCTECEERGIDVRLPFLVRLATVLAAVILISGAPVDGVSITFLDVGQGDCIWIGDTKGHNFLVDGGSVSESRVGTYTIIPYLKYKGVTKLDAVFLTHLDTDHISGVTEILGGGSDTGIKDKMEIEVSRICIAEAVIEDAAYEELAALCEVRGIPVYRLKAGDRIEGNGLCFEVLHPRGDYETDSRNAYSLVMKLETGDHVTALLTGDVESDGEREVSGILRGEHDFTGIDIYKAAHHGSRYSNTEELISLIRPQLAVISCGKDNSYGHPHAETLGRLGQTGSDIRITKDTGAVMIKIKNGQYSVENYIR